MKKLARQVFHLRTASAVLLLIVFCTIYTMSLVILPGRVTFWLSTVALLFIIITAVARVNDITEHTWPMHIRRLGLLGVVGGAIGIIFHSLQYDTFPTWPEVMIRWGFGATWLFTPGMEPWWRFMARSRPMPPIVEAPPVETEKLA